jgi:hypothetical protein
MTCPIPTCPLPATTLGLCPGHFKLVPRPIQSEIYQLCKRHKGGPTHHKAIRRAVLAVNRTLAAWEQQRLESRKERAHGSLY